MSAPTLNAAVAVTPQRISQLAWGYAAPLIIEAAIRNQVFDTLEGAPKTIEQVHQATGASVRGLTAIMNALCGLELLDKDWQGHYWLTPESDAFLVRSKPAFMGGLILRTSEQLIPHWLHLNEIVRTGKPAAAVNQEGTGSEFFEQFVSDLFPMNYPSAQALAVALNLDQGHVLDLAAGSGVWGIALAQNNPRVYISAVDWPNVLPITEKTVAQFGLEDQFTFIPGDLLSADFGVDYDAAILGHILHSEGEARAHALLQKTYDALAPGGAIAIAEFLVNENRKGPPLGLFFAVNMLVNTDEGSTYSFEEISDWLLAAGFTNPHLLPVPGPSPLIVARKP
ncbi:MAG: methyltransferase [Silvibacterium sp.]